MNKHINLLYAIFVLLFGIAHNAPEADNKSGSGVWITGDAFIHDNVLFFRAEKPIAGNATGEVVLLGAPKPNANLLPIFMRAAERHVKLRLYGVLQPFSGSFPAYHDKLPSIQFIAWKLHVPSDPDDLPRRHEDHYSSRRYCVAELQGRTKT
jgi:hypothetical protein